MTPYDHWRQTDPREIEEEREARRMREDAWREDHAEEINEGRAQAWMERNEP